MRGGGGGEQSGIDKISREQSNSVELLDGDVSGSLDGFCKIVLLRLTKVLFFFGHGLSLQA
jgi:hypothetical protein